MSNEALELVRLRNNFYRDNYRRVMTLLFMLVTVLIGLVVAIIYLFMHQPMPKYFAATESGRVLQIVALNRPTMGSTALLKWASQVATAAYTYSFSDYRKNIQALRPYFTDTGWDNFLNGLKSADNISAVEQRKLIVSAVVSGTPIIAKEGVLNGKYAWRVQMPLLVTYVSASQRYQQQLTVNMVVMRISTLQNENGIGVAQFVTK